MIRRFIKFIQAWYRGEDQELEIRFSWWDLGAIVVIIGLLVWIRLK
ncbi:MAG TPA: hypothetical protein VL442_09875 [Mucilaginibacter sp.]|nr:hypothetical protein [Mucilaginibacter sp.]